MSVLKSATRPARYFLIAPSFPATKRSERWVTWRKVLISVSANTGAPPSVESVATNRGFSSACAAWQWRSSSTSLSGKVGKSTRIDCSALSAWNSSSEMSSVYSRNESLSSVSCTCSTFWFRGCATPYASATVSVVARSSRSACLSTTGTIPV